MMKKFFFLMFLFCSVGAFSQKVAIKNNLVYDAFLTPNLSLEVALADQWTLDTQVGMNFFFYTTDPTSSRYKTKKFSHWLIQPEARYWFDRTFKGWFVGAHAHGGQMNLGGKNVPFILDKGGYDMKQHRYEGYFLGAGVSGGYQWTLSDRFHVEASIGLGYAYTHYDRYRCTACGDKLGKGSAHYLGPTRAALSVIYILK